ncbi:MULTISPECIES: hypothetical protein [unclassified Virgibacillus]|uniref:hypothetical protein n=1 Tax=unclassified Virgibacillus TaxID=2620237 RepID=UPI0024DE20E1|nr:hypothetical protein [Virgibacillus sp. LDC-1]
MKQNIRSYIMKTTYANRAELRFGQLAHHSMKTVAIFSDPTAVYFTIIILKE